MKARLRRASLVVMAASALIVFSAPAAAHAGITLEDSEGPLEAGALIELTGTDTKFTSGGIAPIWCTHSVLFGELTGSGTDIEGLVGEGALSGCHINGVIPVEITAIEEELLFEEDGSASFALAFLYDIPVAGWENCVREGTISAQWTSTSDEIHVAGGPLQSTGENCPHVALGDVDGTFTAATPDGDPIYFVP